jgi:Fe-S-cluster containining protein
MSCACEKCIDGCWHNPGWFGTIEEIEKAAKILNLSTEEFCREYLIREWWRNGHIYVPAPRRNFERKERFMQQCAQGTRFTWENTWGNEERRNGKGFVVASWGHNLVCDIPCIFLTEDDKCRIYESRPTECRETFGCKETSFDRKICVEYWENHQGWVQEIAQQLEVEE